ncbi:MAG: CRISPR-associated protein Csx15 [Chloroflexota bacterium]
MLLLNFSHPLTPEQLQQVEALIGRPVEQTYDIPVHFKNDQPFLPQLSALMARIPLTPQQWQSAPILINPPSLNFITVLLLAELHGRMGYFPPILRLRPVAGAVPPSYEVAEILNLNEVRERARAARYANGGENPA